MTKQSTALIQTITSDVVPITSLTTAINKYSSPESS